LFFPGSSSTANTYLVAETKQINQTATASLSDQLADVNRIYQAGLLELNVLSKNYLRETPLAAFPPKVALNGDFAMGTSAGTTGLSAAINMRAAGRPYYVDPTIALQPAVNFEVLIRFPALVSTPSGFNGRIGVVFDGYFMRASQ